MACSLSLAPLASFACWRGRSTAGPSHSDVPSQAHSARFPVPTRTHREVLALMDRAEEKAGREDVGEQALNARVGYRISVFSSGAVPGLASGVDRMISHIMGFRNSPAVVPPSLLHD